MHNIKMNFHTFSLIILINFFVILLNAKQIENNNSNKNISNNNSNMYNSSNVIRLENHSQSPKAHHLHPHHHRHKHNNHNNTNNNNKDNSTREMLRNSLANHSNKNNTINKKLADAKPLSMAAAPIESLHPKNPKQRKNNKKPAAHLRSTTVKVHHRKNEKLADEFDYDSVGRDFNDDFEYYNGVQPRIDIDLPPSTSSSSSSSAAPSSAATPYIIRSTTPIAENRVCANTKIVNIPYRTTEVHNKPVYRHYSEPCNNNGQICSGVRLVHEPVARTVIKYRKSKQIVYTCCSGWEKLNEADTGCNKPICTKECHNGGICTQPDTCECSTGYTGLYCEKDINECQQEKPCDQYCFNTEGSYYCTCREGFSLHTDKQSCKKRFNPDVDAIEARDLETNDIDDLNYDDINARLEKIEKILAAERYEKIKFSNNIDRKFTNALESVNNLQQRIDVIEHKQQDIKNIDEKIKVYDDQAKRIEHVMDLLFKCRTKSSIYCP